jgi:uncharacterized protein (TIGR03437 family)
VDSSGSVYVVGSTSSTDFPVTANNGVQQTLTSKSGGNAFLAVLNPAGSQLVYGTYFGGSGTDVANTVAVIPGTGVAMGGLTTSSDLPVTPDATQTTLVNKPGGFYAELNPPGLSVPGAHVSSETKDARRLDQTGGFFTATFEEDIPAFIWDHDSEYNFTLRIIGNIDSTSGKIRQIRKHLHVVLRTGAELFTESGLTVPDGVYNISVVNPALTPGSGPLIQMTGTFPANTAIAQGRQQAHLLDATLGAPAIGLVLGYPPAVVNAASFAPPSTVSPGEIVTIFGENLGPSTLTTAQLDSTGQELSTLVAGTQVFFDADPAPIVYTSAGQVSVIVPYGVQGKTSVHVIPIYNGALQDTAALNIAPSAPGIFTADGKQAAALNQDGSYNSAANPAARGSTVVLFATGEGQTTPAGIDGQLAISTYPKPVLAVSVTIGGQPATLAYFGAAPDETAGLLQLNVVVPQNIQPGNAAVVLTVGGASSQSGVTIAVN